MEHEKLHSIAVTARPELESYRNCGAINSTIQTALENAGIECKYVEGNLTEYGMRGEGPEHAFVIVTDNRIVDSQPVIVDGAIRQFSEERKNAGEVFYSIDSKESLPLVAVLTPEDELYSRYLY